MSTLPLPLARALEEPGVSAYQQGVYAGLAAAGRSASHLAATYGAICIHPGATMAEITRTLPHFSEYNRVLMLVRRLETLGLIETRRERGDARPVRRCWIKGQMPPEEASK